ncbi:putative reverse transcriptase domain-containing protein [Tanacetum coccineum]
MEAPTQHQHHLLLADQCLSSRNINTTNDNDEFIPHSSFEVSAHGILASNENNLQSSNSSMSIHDEKLGRKIPTTNSTSFNHVQPNCPPKCYNCGKMGHKEKDCRSKNVSSGTNARPAVVCYECGERGQAMHAQRKLIDKVETCEVKRMSSVMPSTTRARMS